MKIQKYQDKPQLTMENIINAFFYRYTIEVADFDFAQSSDLEYMTFSQRLKAALNNAFNRTHEYVDESNVWSPSRKYGSMQ